LGFPDTVQGVVTSRIDRLVPSEQLTLKVASVIGRAFSCQILKDMFPVERDRPLQPAQLESLSRRDLIAPQDVVEDLDYQFRHVITQEVAYDLIPPTQRQSLHQAIAEWYETEHREDLAPFFALLAKHWSRTDRTDKAILYLEKSGESAARQFANSEAIQFFTEAIKRNETAQVQVSPERSAHWHRQVAEACYNLGDLVASLDHFRSALSQLELPFPERRMGTLGGSMLELGKQFGLKALAKLICRRTAKSRSQLLLAAQCYERLAQIHYLNNSRLQTIHAVFKALNLAEAVGSSAVLARCYANAAVVAGLLLMHGQARHYAKRASEVAAEIDEPDCTSYVGLILGIYWVTVGEWEVADRLLRSAMDIAERIHARRRWAESAFTLVIGDWRCGKITRCRELATAGHEAGVKDRVPQVELWGLSWSLRCVLAQTEDSGLVRRLTNELGDCLSHNELTAADRILGHGMLAAGLWRLGEKESALAEAFRVTGLIAETNQISHYLMAAYSALFEVYSGSLIDSTDPVERQRIKAALNAARRSMWEFGVMYPVGRVQYGLHEGQYHRNRGQLRRANRVWKKALKLAQKLHMPFLEGQLHAELARHGRGHDDQKAFHLRKARELFHAAETWHDLSRLEQVHATGNQNASG
jgi:tetratricopeptide (TPR) repeat protein